MDVESGQAELIGVIGFGSMGRQHVRAIRKLAPEARIAVYCRGHREEVRVAREGLDLFASRSSLLEFIEGLGVLLVCVQEWKLYGVLVEILSVVSSHQRLRIVCEKPLMLSPSSRYCILDLLARSPNVTIQMASNRRFYQVPDHFFRDVKRIQGDVFYNFDNYYNLGYPSHMKNYLNLIYGIHFVEFFKMALYAGVSDEDIKLEVSRLGPYRQAIKLTSSKTDATVAINVNSGFDGRWRFSGFGDKGLIVSGRGLEDWFDFRTATFSVFEERTDGTRSSLLGFWRCFLAGDDSKISDLSSFSRSYGNFF